MPLLISDNYHYFRPPLFSLRLILNSYLIIYRLQDASSTVFTSTIFTEQLTHDNHLRINVFDMNV